MDAVANRVRRVASGWETQLSISVEDILSAPTMFELVQAFCGVRVDAKGVEGSAGPATRLRLRTDVLAGTWEALVSGQVDLAIGVSGEYANPGGIELRPLGDCPSSTAWRRTTRWPVPGPLEDAQLVHHRAVAVADTAQRMTPITVNLLPGQDVLTVSASMRAKLEALLRGLGCGFVPEPLARAQLDAGRLVQKETARQAPVARLHYAWRAERGALGLGRALQWWLHQLESPTTRRALLERHGGLLP
jgi:DNA-binding transcriptional LysR family regulator